MIPRNESPYFLLFAKIIYLQRNRSLLTYQFNDFLPLLAPTFQVIAHNQV